MNYYNDFEPFAAKWLTELMTDGLIPEGYVDDRSILEVQPDDLAGYDQCHFFAGIGGWPRALDLAGWDSTRPVWTASLPCQPFSCAGQHGGEKDERHLWPVFFSLVEKCRPPVIVGEQVASKDGREWLAGIQTDLETLGYSCAAADLPAAMFAPHKRNRLFWCAVDYTTSEHKGTHRRNPDEAAQESTRQIRQEQHPALSGRSSPTGRVADSDGGRPPQGSETTKATRHGSSIEPKSFWSNSTLIPCADGKYRRVPGKRVEDPSGAGTGDNRGKVGGQGRQPMDTGEEGIRQGNGEIGADGVDADGSLSKRVADSESCRRQLQSSESRINGTLESKGKLWESISSKCDGHSELENKLEIEPLLFPLVDGIPNRVGILRGAGNAIVPQVAAEFIKAVKGII